ncbi:MAG: hypothetical protein Q9217_005356 [Psora testacea]
MSPSDDALDFLESLVIFNRICPFALEHLPAMSRRVFDVGLDMGRIRNGLKPNKEEKRSKTYRSTATPERKIDGYTGDTPNPHQMVVVSQIRHRKSSPQLQGWGLEYGHPDDTVIPPSNHADSPLPANHSSSPEYIHGERPLHSSQSKPPSESPNDAQKPNHMQHSSDEPQNFDLKPPPPNSRVKHIDTLSQQLFSGDHLRVILKDPSFFLRFTAFLNRYKPNLAPVLVRYMEAQKALKAVEYANALSETITPSPGEHHAPCPAASIDPQFEAQANRSFDTLVTEALPAFITNGLTKVVTEYMVREITGRGMPVMRELVGGLAEVFCLADPSIEDCPIVYASEEFYRTSRYSRDDVIGRNCRFLQGPKTDMSTIRRLSAMIKAGQESCETVLNYRRDGSPFMNLLLIAPLYDNKGIVRYFIGAQIDVSGLVEDGRGLDSFERLLSESRPNRNRESVSFEANLNHKHLKSLNELGQMLSADESSIFRQHSRASSVNDNASTINYSSRGTPGRRRQSVRQPRRVLGDDDDNEPKVRNAWSLPSSLPSGRLPGVYQNVSSWTSFASGPLLLTTILQPQYLLVRPYPSLRIIFVSPALRIPGLLQSPFLPHIGGSQHVRDGLFEAFEQGAAVTAKITWLPNGRPARASGASDGGEQDIPDSRFATGSRRGPPPEAKTRYISCTPMLGADDQVGVWMVVMVENELITGSLASREKALARYNGNIPIPLTPSEYEYGDGYTNGEEAGTRRNSAETAGSEKRGKGGSEAGRLYADYVRGTGGSLSKPGLENGQQAEVDGLPGEDRVQEISTPTEEKKNML